MPFSDRDIVQQQALLRKQVADIPTQQNGVDMLSQLSDVSIGIDTDVADGDVLTWVAADSLWENLPSAGGGLDPSTEQVEFYTATTTGIANNAPTTLDFTGTGSSSVGTNVILDTGTGGGALIQDDGVYAMMCMFFLTADSGGDTFNSAQAAIQVSTAVQDPVTLFDTRAPGIISGGSQHQARIVLTWVGFMNSGDHFNEAAVLMSGGGSGTWGVNAAMWVRQLSSGGTGSGGSVASVVAGTGITVDDTDPANPIVAASGVLSVVAGTNVTVDDTDPANPIVASSGVASVVAGTNITVDDTDPENPIVAATSGSFDFTGSGSPEGVTTAAVGASYGDTTNGALYWKITGAGNTGWALANAGSGDVPGVFVDSTGHLYLLADGTVSGAAALQLGDLFTFGGIGNGFLFGPATPGVDGTQIAVLTLGSSSQFAWHFEANGSTLFPGAIKVDPSTFPTSDPHSAGELFMVGYSTGLSPGTLMVSAG